MTRELRNSRNVCAAGNIAFTGALVDQAKPLIPRIHPCSRKTGVTLNRKVLLIPISRPQTPKP